MKQRKVGRPRRPVDIDYIIQITSWDWGYSLSVNRTRLEQGPVHEFRHLQISGTLLGPALKGVEAVRVTLIPDADFSKLQVRDNPIPHIGGLCHEKKVLHVSLEISTDVLAPILVMLTADQFRYVRVSGTPLRYRSGDVTGISLQMDLREDEMPSI